jgi:hypothetical protein
MKPTPRLVNLSSCFGFGDLKHAQGPRTVFAVKLSLVNVRELMFAAWEAPCFKVPLSVWLPSSLLPGTLTSCWCVYTGTGQGRENQVEAPPDFLWTLAALANFMRLSLLKAAHVVLGGAMYRTTGFGSSFIDAPALPVWTMVGRRPSGPFRRPRDDKPMTLA